MLWFVVSGMVFTSIAITCMVRRVGSLGTTDLDKFIPNWFGCHCDLDAPAVCVKEVEDD